MRRSIGSVLVVLLLGVPAHAEGTEPAAAALALFDEGRDLAARGDYTHACEKFEAARAYSRWVGVLLNLADCYEHIGRSASAWATFREAADLAGRSNDARTSYAIERASALEPALGSVTIEPPAGDVRITLDTRVVPAGSLRSRLPVDPGPHRVTAEADGFTMWSSTVDVRVRTNTWIVVPALTVPEARASIVRPPPPPGARTRIGVSLILGGAGVAAIGTALVFGRKAMALRDQALDGHCTPAFRCDDDGARMVDLARDRGNVATISAIVGLGAVVTGIIVYRTSPREASIVPVAGPRLVGIAVGASL